MCGTAGRHGGSELTGVEFDRDHRCRHSGVCTMICWRRRLRRLDHQQGSRLRNRTDEVHLQTLLQPLPLSYHVRWEEVFADELRRFDLAERAYRRALSINGRTALLLNNFGYHYLLQGKKSQARAILEEAARKAPDDPTIQANLELLEASPGRPSRVASHK